MLAIGGAIVTAASLTLLLVSSASVAITGLMMGLAMLGLGALGWASSNGVVVLNTAHNAVIAGKLEEAERLLDESEQQVQLGYVRRAADLQRAAIAFSRGDLDVARARAEAAMARPLGVVGRMLGRAHVTQARALRALILALSGERAAAQAEIQAVSASPDAGPETLARALVAEAVLLEKSGEREALARHLGEKRRLLFDRTPLRERALLRAYQRMLLAPRGGAYRSAAPREEDRGAGEPPVSAWIARVAPAAAPFASAHRAQPGAGTGDAEAPVDAALVDGAAKHLERKSGVGWFSGPKRLLVLWAGAIVVFLAIWQLLNPPGVDEVTPVRHVEDVEPSVLVTLQGWVVAIAILAVMMSITSRRNAAQGRRFGAALTALARGDRGAESEVETWARGRLPLPAVQAELWLAREAERRGDLRGALARCDRALGIIAGNSAIRAQAAVALQPDLIALRAFILAARGERERARAELALLARDFAAYPFHALAEARVGLLLHAKDGDLEGGARLADGWSADLPISLRDETLADLVRALARPDSIEMAEVHRLRRELEEDAALRAWLAETAPGVASTFMEEASLAAEEEAARAVPSA